jgi:catechol 2,3-dioxygenase
MDDVGVDLAWGIGRHGPRNNTVLMVKDMDGNMGKISSDLAARLIEGLRGWC